MAGAGAATVGFAAGSVSLEAGDVYWAGSRVAGALSFTLQRPLALQAIYVEFHGEANTSWSDTETERYGNSERTREVTYEGTENYFNFPVAVITGPTTLNPGPHTFNFQYQMPSIVPSSYEGANGRIEYKVRAYVDFGNLGPPQPDMEIEKLFTVIAPYNLNLEPCAREPINIELETIPSSCFCCEAGPLTVCVNLPVSGYCPGQYMPIEIVANNQSNIEVQQILISLRKNMNFTSDNPTSDIGIDEGALISVKKGPVPSKTTRNYSVKMEVPPETLSNFNSCRIIKAEYYFKVEVKLSGCNEDMEDEESIYLGTVPIQGFQDLNYIHPFKDRMPQTPLPQLEPIYPSNTPYPTPQPNPSPGFNPAGIPSPPYPGVEKNGYQQTTAYSNIHSPSFPGYQINAPTSGYHSNVTPPGYQMNSIPHGYQSAGYPGYSAGVQSAPYPSSTPYPTASMPSYNQPGWQNTPSAPPPNL